MENFWNGSNLMVSGAQSGNFYAVQTYFIKTSNIFLLKHVDLVAFVCRIIVFLVIIQATSCQA